MDERWGKGRPRQGVSGICWVVYNKVCLAYAAEVQTSLQK